MAITLDIGVKKNTIPAWNNFLRYIYDKYPSELKEYHSYRYRVDNELKSHKAIWFTDDVTYSKLLFEDEKHKTLFLLKWQ